MVYLETVYLGWSPQAVSWAQHILDARWPSSAQQVIELLDKVVDKTLAFIRAECRENIVSVDINLTTSLCNLLDCFLQPRYGVTLEKLDLILVQYFAFSYIWVFSGNLHDSSMAKFDQFARDLLSQSLNFSLPVLLTIWDWKIDQ